jgi:hypothetical protein
LLTVALKPKSLINKWSGSFLSLPIKKQISFFFTCYEQTDTVNDPIYLGFSASDF